jgi:hypothetical protein
MITPFASDIDPLDAFYLRGAMLRPEFALQLFPTAHELLARKKDHGRAEAALIALSGIHLFNRIPAQVGIVAGRNPAMINDHSMEER